MVHHRGGTLALHGGPAARMHRSVNAARAAAESSPSAVSRCQWPGAVHPDWSQSPGYQCCVHNQTTTSGPSVGSHRASCPTCSSLGAAKLASLRRETPVLQNVVWCMLLPDGRWSPATRDSAACHQVHLHRPWWFCHLPSAPPYPPSDPDQPCLKRAWLSSRQIVSSFESFGFPGLRSES